MPKVLIVLAVLTLMALGAGPAYAGDRPWFCPEGTARAEDGTCVPEWWYRVPTDRKVAP